MKLLVTSISAHSPKANLIYYQFINTSTILDGCQVSGFAPKSVTLVEGQEQEVPQFVANGIFGFNWGHNIKSLEKQLHAKAPAGMKHIWRSQAVDLFQKVSELNVYVPTEPAGMFIGSVGESITFVTKSVECVYTREWTSEFGWHHNGHGWERPSGTKRIWKITDMDGNVFMFASSGNKINNTLYEANPGTVFQAVVDKHKVYHDTRQTWIRNIKLNPGLFQTLN